MLNGSGAARRPVAVRRVLALAAGLGMVMTLAAAPAAIAVQGHIRRGLHSEAGPGLTLAQAPAGLRAAVSKTLARRKIAHSSVFHQQKLTAADGAPNDEFGWSVAISGSTAVIGAPASFSAPGAAYVFTRSGGAWSQQAKLTLPGSNESDMFGNSVAISGSTVVVGAWGENQGAGAAYVFVRSGTAWSQRAELTAANGDTNTDFGWSVAISGSTAVIGAQGKAAAYVFVRSGTAWSQRAELTPNGTQGGESGKFFEAGTAYVFTRSSGAWSQQAEVAAAKGPRTSYFGSSAALSGTTAVIGAPGTNAQTGAASVFVNV
jgi:hypothetical protein